MSAEIRNTAESVDSRKRRRVWSLVGGFDFGRTGLSGVYGDVQRVKVLFNKKDNALIQYAEPAQAQLGEYLGVDRNE